MVVGFAEKYLRCFDDLVLLDALVGDSERWWDASVTQAILLTPSTARATLDYLAARNLLEIRVTTDVRYRFHPGTPALRRAAVACVRAYRADPEAVARLLTRRPRPAAAIRPTVDNRAARCYLSRNVR